jgi:hypothetical protein
MTKFRPFYLDNKKFLTNQKCFIITSETENLYFLISILNSWVFDFAFKDYFPELLGGTRELSKIFFEKIPIPKISTKEQEPFILLINQIINKIELGEDTTILKLEIDQLVYDLYKITNEEKIFINKTILSCQ